jgi:hypothetical protein
MTNSNNLSQNCALFCLKEGLAMGAPSSAVPSEIFLLIANKVLGYFRFVADVLCTIILLHINSVLDAHNHLHPNLNFTTELENKSKINYLDLSICRQCNTLKFSVFKKQRVNTYSKHPL